MDNLIIGFVPAIQTPLVVILWSLVATTIMGGLIVLVKVVFSK